MQTINRPISELSDEELAAELAAEKARLKTCAEAQRLFTPVPLYDLQDIELAPPEFIVDKIIPRGVVTLLGGHGGSGKSVLALVIAAHIAAGRHFAGLEVRQGRALFVSLEDSGELVKWRLRAICESYSLPFDDVVDNLTILDGSDSDATLMEKTEYGVLRPTALWAELEKEIFYDFYVVDNASDAFGGDENKRAEVRSFIRLLGKKAKSENAGFLLLAHIDKYAARNSSQGNTYSGSTQWHNSVRSRLALLEDRQGLKLVHEKSNFGPKAEPIPLIFAGPVIVPASFSADDDQQQRETQADELLEVMRQAIEKGATLSSNRTNNGNFFITIRSYGLPKDFDREDVYRALDHLLDTKRVRVEEYRRDSKPKTRIVITDSANPPTAANILKNRVTESAKCGGGGDRRPADTIRGYGGSMADSMSATITTSSVICSANPPTDWPKSAGGTNDDEQMW